MTARYPIKASFVESHRAPLECIIASPQMFMRLVIRWTSRSAHPPGRRLLVIRSVSWIISGFNFREPLHADGVDLGDPVLEGGPFDPILYLAGPRISERGEWHRSGACACRSRERVGVIELKASRRIWINNTHRCHSVERASLDP